MILKAYPSDSRRLDHMPPGRRMTCRPNNDGHGTTEQLFIEPHGELPAAPKKNGKSLQGKRVESESGRGSESPADSGLTSRHGGNIDRRRLA
jgi:hypothetical protein